MKTVSNYMDVRIKQLEIENFRSIAKANIVFPNTDDYSVIEEKPSVLGLYGQNGSGKTSVIMAMGLIKRILSGEKLTSDDTKCIRIGSDHASLGVTFCLTYPMVEKSGEVVKNDNMPIVEVNYCFDIIKTQDDQAKNSTIKVGNEIIKMRMSKVGGGIIFPKQIMFDTRKSQSDDKGIAFGSKQKHEILLGFDKKNMKRALELKKQASENGQSFLFMKEFRELLESVVKTLLENEDMKAVQERVNADFFDAEHLTDVFARIDEAGEEESEAVVMFTMFSLPFITLSALRWFSMECFHVLGTSSTGLVYGGVIPLVMIRRDRINDSFVPYRINIPRDKVSTVPKTVYPRVKETIRQIGMVLSKVVPGLTIETHEVSADQSEENKDVQKSQAFELISCRNDIKIPLSLESDGIKKIVSILILLIAAYNDPSVTVVIDEIDAGIFEYLLGEILKVISESARGQVIFSAHNLRPLEVMPSKFVLFTTTNPQNTFVHIPSRGNSNLRDTYFRRIILGGIEEQVYNPTDRFEIDMAFYSAGHVGEEV